MAHATSTKPLSERLIAWFKYYQLILLAMVGSAAFHGVLLFAGSYRGTYDAWVHIFFADHYARSWWNPWEPRWYTGFTLFSYPPLTHQLTALGSKLFSLPTAFILVMLTASIVTTLGVYRFSRLWVDHRPASYAALLAVFSSSIAETVHVFGQLPTMFVMGVLLNALPYVWYWLERGRMRDLLRAWALLMVAAAGHHVTTLFGMVFFSGPIIATVLLRKFRTPRTDEPSLADEGRLGLRSLWALALRRLRRVFPCGIRTGIFGVGLILVLVLTVLPYWLWSRSDPITQITIPHASRDSFLVNTAAGFMFFVVPWGLLIFILPYALYKGFSSANWILASSLAGLALLGTGGTTPIPALLLRGSFYILTLDRFTFWATIVILPFAGLFVESLAHGRLGGWIAARLGVLWRYGILAALIAGLMAFAIFVANLTQFRKFQPAPLNMTPIVEFLAKDNHDAWRYMTLGFGDQMAWLSAQTTALNVEGNYHSARRLPELTSTPIERLDGAKFTSIPGLGSLQQFVTNPHKYHLKYIFVNDAFYEPLLYFAGWHRLGRLENNVDVWERSDVPPLPAAIPMQVYPAWQRLMWGVLPVGSLFVALSIFALTAWFAPRLSISEHWRQFPILRRIATWCFIQRWILNDQAIPAMNNSSDWQIWRRLIARLPLHINLTPLARRALYGTLLLGAVLALLLMLGFRLRQATISPEAVILAYYDNLDFKRFSQSYDYLDTTLSRQEYLRHLSTQGGIVASFAKLNNLHTDIIPLTADTLRARVDVEWLTALGTYQRTYRHTLRRVEGTWKIEYIAPRLQAPRETFISTADVGFYQDLPLQTLNQTALTRGVLDRSVLSVRDLRLVYAPTLPIGFTPEPYDAGRITGRFQGLISVIGAVKNADSLPSHVTLTAILRNAQGERIAETNAMDALIHQLLPQEVSPFRIDFFGADASQILAIDDIASVEVLVRGVPTAYNLERPFSLTQQGQNLTLYNGGRRLIDVPRLIVAHESRLGGLRWVDAMTLEFAVAPDDSQSVRLPSPPPQLRTLNVPITLSAPRLTPWTGDIPHYLAYGYSR